MTRTAKSSFVKALVLVTVLTTASFAGSKKETAAYSKTSVENLLNAINSSNDGLRRSAIYFSGKYRVVETVNALSGQLKKEKDPRTRILIALSLYAIGAPEGLLEVKESASSDTDTRVRKMCSEIYETYRMNDVINLYSANEN